MFHPVVASLLFYIELRKCHGVVEMLEGQHSSNEGTAGKCSCINQRKKAAIYKSRCPLISKGLSVGSNVIVRRRPLGYAMYSRPIATKSKAAIAEMFH